MAENTRATTALKAQQEGSLRQQKGILKQLEEHNHAISGITGRLDQLTVMLKSLVECQQHKSVPPSSYEGRGMNHEEGSYGHGMNFDERGSLPWGVRLDIPHFDGTNPARWIFKPELIRGF